GQVFIIELIVIVMPYIILDRTWHIYVIELILFFTFLYFDIKFQGRIPYGAWKDDIPNMMISMLVGLIGGYAVRKSRFQALENGRIYILQRNTDELTTLPNRRKLFHELRKSFDGRASKIKCLFIADIDYFKRYNDSFGHPAGDEVLHKIGECFTDFCKDTGFEIYRYGGEEFIGLYRAESEIDFAKTVHSLCKKVRDLKIERFLPNLPYITVSIGFATAKKENLSDYEQFISIADSALYQAKSKGRNCTIEYDASTCTPQS
ncbi:MAG: GGDEF domain-containing protein, partial [Treponema sp.]